MTASELREKIKALAKQVYTQATPVDVDSPGEIDLDIAETFPILGRFPDLKKVIVDLFTKQYELFIQDIEWVAPRPTTFRILLANGESFLMHYTPRSWVATIEGKKYYLANIGEEEQAVQTIARVLSYGQKDEATTPVEGGEETTTSTTSSSSSSSAGTEEAPAEEAPEETPAPEEEA